jgi:nucleotide-binding universal stress UspA family protein
MPASDGPVGTSDGPVLLCYDGSPEATEAIRAAGRLIGGGPAVVLTVYEPAAIHLLTPVSDTIAALTGLADEIDDASAQAAAKHADEGVLRAGEAGFEATPLVGAGRAPDVIAETAQELGARVVVMGHGGGLSGLLGSAVRAVLHHSRRPLLVASEADG